MLPSIIRLVFLTIAFGLLGACASLPFEKVGSYDSGTVLILPARDVVQRGVPHEKGKGSGAMLTRQVVTGLRKGPLNPVTTDNTAFTNLDVADKQAAIAEARRLNADYVLQIVLGEFQNAAPMSFRPDYVTLESAVMYKTSDSQEVWRNTRAWRLQKGNLGNHLGLIKQIGAGIGKSLNTRQQSK